MDSSNYNGVKAFRLITGEDLFGTVKHFCEDTFHEKSFVELANAAVISMRMDEKTKQPMVGFAPFSPFGTSKDVKIRTDKVTMTYTPKTCLLYTSPSPRDLSTSRMPSSA